MKYLLKKHTKRLILKSIGIFLLFSCCVNLFGCNIQTEKNYFRINEKNFYYVTDEKRQEWKQPIEELIVKAFVKLDEEYQSLGFDANFNTDESAIAAGYGCGLFDVTKDGIPELLIHPFGYFGSSGTVTYFIYDIFSGQYLGKIDGGNEESWCVYYNVQEDTLDIMGQYGLRGGWSWRDRYISMIAYDESISEYKMMVYLQTSHEIEMNNGDNNVEEAKEFTEVYSDTVYYIYHRKVSLDEYYSEYNTFIKNCIRIPETEFIFFDWDDISDDEDSNEIKGKKMAEALITSAQQFLKY